MSSPRWMHVVLVVLSSACCPSSADTRQPSNATQPAALPPPAPPPPAPVATAPAMAQPTTAPPATAAASLAPPATPTPPPAAAPVPATPPAPATPETVVAAPKREGNPKGRDDGIACSAGKECKSGTCEGQGCGFNAGRCAPASRACTKDVVQYCGCNGETFGASGSCPGRTYRNKGACK